MRNLGLNSSLRWQKKKNLGLNRNPRIPTPVLIITLGELFGGKSRWYDTLNGRLAKSTCFGQHALLDLLNQRALSISVCHWLDIFKEIIELFSHNLELTNRTRAKEQNVVLLNCHQFLGNVGILVPEIFQFLSFCSRNRHCAPPPLTLAPKQYLGPKGLYSKVCYWFSTKAHCSVEMLQSGKNIQTSSLGVPGQLKLSNLDCWGL